MGMELKTESILVCDDGASRDKQFHAHVAAV